MNRRWQRVLVGSLWLTPGVRGGAARAVSYGLAILCGATALRVGFTVCRGSIASERTLALCVLTL